MIKQSFQQRVALVLVAFLLSAAAFAQQKPVILEAPSTVGAHYIEPSVTRTLHTGERIDQLFTRNTTQDYILQRLTSRTYWFQRQYYSTVFYVGGKGVLLFDVLEGRSEYIRKAIAEVTKLPVTAIVYSHNHADHIGDTRRFIENTPENDITPRIIASKATADKMTFLQSTHPKPTEIVAWPNGSFKFEGLTIEFHGFEHAAHTDDHGVWLLVDEKVAHLPDHINPDQPPFWGFAGSETFAYYESNLEQLAKLDWTFLNGGHGNIGAKADVDFYRMFLSDLKQAVGKALGEVAWGTGIDASKINAHTAFLPAWLKAIGKNATDRLRLKYGSYYGFEAATPRNAEMVAEAMFSYR